MEPVLSFEGVSKRYALASGVTMDALRDVTFSVAEGECVAVVGRSGSGKSTLLHLAAAIDEPTAGAVRVFGQDTRKLSDGRRTRLRRDAIGLVFQFFHLMPQLSVLENVALPAWIAGDDAAATETRARDLLARVGLDARTGDRADRLSGGEMQRVALCRALLRRPRLLLADEPTGNLDDESGRAVMDLLVGLARERGVTLLYVTHSREFAGRAGRVLHLRSGALQDA